MFYPVNFSDGLNVVIAEIRLPENRDRDTHNLGKTTLGSVLDFCFLKGRNKDYFLFKYPEKFNEFIFFLEIELLDQSYLTLRRKVDKPSKINFKKHTSKHQDYTNLPDSEWDHVNLPFKKAREMLDSLLDWRGLSPWSFRKGLGYQLRSQNDYSDVVHLGRFASAHSDWKPFIAHILGFNADLISLHYQKENEIEEKQDLEKNIRNELAGPVEDLSRIEGILLLKQKEADEKRKFLDDFDFRGRDKEKTKELVGDIDQNIAELNKERYALNYRKTKISKALKKDRILFDPEEAQEIFSEANIVFQGQIKKDFEELIKFNKAITEERETYLNEELKEANNKLKLVNSKLNSLGRKRSEILSFLSDTDVFTKYKSVSDDLVTLRADITSLERQRGYLERLHEIRADIRSLSEELAGLQTEIEQDVDQQNSNNESFFSYIRIYFSEIVEEVINRKGLLSVLVNKQGHLEFKAEILDELGKTTSADIGHTYRKLLCIAFDLAILRSHLDKKFPRFVFHDGVFESLDDRKKEKLVQVYKQYADMGIQSIITLIDSDLPITETNSAIFDQNEVVLTLHDESKEGRLFKIDSW